MMSVGAPTAVCTSTEQEDSVSRQLVVRLMGTEKAHRVHLSPVACLGMGFSASLVSHAEHPGCGGTARGAQRWQNGTQSPACPQGRAEEAGHSHPPMKDVTSWLSAGLDHT